MENRLVFSAQLSFSPQRWKYPCHTLFYRPLWSFCSLCVGRCPLVMRYGWARLSWMLGAYSTYKKPLRSVINICQIAKLCYAFSFSSSFQLPNKPPSTLPVCFRLPVNWWLFFFCSVLRSITREPNEQTSCTAIRVMGEKGEREKKQMSRKKANLWPFIRFTTIVNTTIPMRKTKKKGWNVSSTEGSQKKTWT